MQNMLCTRVYTTVGKRGTVGPMTNTGDAGLAHVGVRDLRSSLAALIRRAGQGERIVITVDGKPVAQLGPLQPDRAGIELHDLAAAGLIEPPGQPPEAMADRAMPAPYPVPADVRLDRLIDQIRGL